MKDAFRAALHDPASWAPAAGALVIGAGGFDDNISHWASRRTPLFGSRDGAIRWSNDLRAATRDGMLLTILAGVGTDSVGEAGLTLLADGGISTSTSFVTSYLKGAVGRTRPDGSSDSSFPSGHATAAFTYAALGCENLRSLDLSPGVRLPMEAGLEVLAGGTAWARVEAGVHYPSDVLAGAAIGNFLSVLLDRLVLPRDRTARMDVEITPGQASFNLRWRF
ncbi:MAG TPA: phosphatase PAP2 family protein [Candidatus Saccharimonadales bacterium]|nr:phosphatase PAP2 family protein [Candidatus Saccharimonadales bacterium]